MFGYSETRNEVFTLARRQYHKAESKIKIDMKLLQIRALTAWQWGQVKRLQGKFTVAYLRLRYGGPNTYILLAFAESKLVHVEWIVPACRLRRRYSFVSDDSYSIISCLTSRSFRGLGIYPSQLQKVAQSGIPAKMFWIWTASTNTPSLKGIRKAGGVKVAEVVQKKWFWGCFAKAKYYPLGDNSK